MRPKGPHQQPQDERCRDDVKLIPQSHASRAIRLDRRKGLFHGKQRWDELALPVLIEGKAELEEAHQPKEERPLFLRVVFRPKHPQPFRGLVNRAKALRRDDPIPRKRLLVACVVRPQDGVNSVGEPVRAQHGGVTQARVAAVVERDAEVVEPRGQLLLFRRVGLPNSAQRAE
jgi:hypothetical protein